MIIIKKYNNIKKLEIHGMESIDTHTLKGIIKAIKIKRLLSLNGEYKSIKITYDFLKNVTVMIKKNDDFLIQNVFGFGLGVYDWYDDEEKELKGMFTINWKNCLGYKKSVIKHLKNILKNRGEVGLLQIKLYEDVKI